MHPAAPHYNTLLRVDPGDRTGTRIVGDLAASWTAARDGRTYTFSLRRGVRFHDGSELTSRDVKASYDKIIFPPPGVVSNRQGEYRSVEAVRGAGPLHGGLPPQVARGLVRGVARLPLQLDLQGRHPGPRRPLVREERHGNGAVPLRRVREGLTLDRAAQPGLLGQGQALSRWLSRDLRQGVVDAGGGDPRAARDDPVPRFLAAGAGHPRPGSGQPDHGAGEPLGVLEPASPSTTRRSRSTTGACAVR